MEEHLKSVSQEVKHTSDLAGAKKKEVETEDHLTQLVVREASRYQQVAHVGTSPSSSPAHEFAAGVPADARGGGGGGGAAERGAE